MDREVFVACIANAIRAGDQKGGRRWDLVLVRDRAEDIANKLPGLFRHDRIDLGAPDEGGRCAG